MAPVWVRIPPQLWWYVVRHKTDFDKERFRIHVGWPPQKALLVGYVLVLVSRHIQSSPPKQPLATTVKETKGRLADVGDTRNLRDIHWFWTCASKLNKYYEVYDQPEFSKRTECRFELLASKWIVSIKAATNRLDGLIALPAVHNIPDLGASDSVK